MRNSPKSHILQISTHLAPVCRRKFRVCRRKFRVCRRKFRVCRRKFRACRRKFRVCRRTFRVCRRKSLQIWNWRPSWGGPQDRSKSVSRWQFWGVLPDRIEPEQDMEIDAKAFRFGSCWEAPSPPPPRKLPGSSPSPGKLLGSYPFPATSCGQVKPPLPSHKLRTYAATLRIHLLADWNLLINSCFCSVAVRGRCCWGRRAFQS